MISEQYPRSPKEQVGGLCHLGRLIDKIRMRNDGLLQDYNYLTIGFDKYLLDKALPPREQFSSSAFFLWCRRQPREAVR